MINEIYNSQILRYAACISRIGQLVHPDATAQKRSELCGSTITVSLKMENNVVTEFAQKVRACALAQAAAAIMAQHVIGATANELKTLRKTILTMLTENGLPPTGKFNAFACLEPIKNYKERHASTMLIFDALIDCIEQIEYSRACEYVC